MAARLMIRSYLVASMVDLLSELDREKWTIVFTEHVPQPVGKRWRDKSQITHRHVGDLKAFGAATFFHGGNTFVMQLSGLADAYKLNTIIKFICITVEYF